MKLKRISKSKLKEMKTIVIIWKPDMITEEDYWCISEFEVRSYDYEIRLFLPPTDMPNNNESGSFEEAMLKAQIAYLGKQVFKISTLKQDFCPPCGYDVCGKDVSVHEVKL